LQAKIAALSRQAANDMTAVLQGTEVQLTEQFKKEGMIVTSGTPAEAKLIADRMRSYWTKWAAQHGPDAQKALAEVEQAINQ
jgi:TRAP-type C4-dicarboxylate transport system substrate-binding protein